MDFIPHDEDTIKEMLETIGVDSLEELFNDIPKDLMVEKLNLPEGLSEPDLQKYIEKLARKNKVYSYSFLGAGCYYHYIPSLVDFVASRSEFYTSYTPYQAEISQGFLQAMFEYQSIISRLTGMDVANASMYDGSTALAEASTMAALITRKKKILILEGVHPEYIEVVKTYCWAQKISIKIVKEEELLNNLDDSVAAVLIQSPNFFGEIEDLESISRDIKNKAPNSLIIHSMTDPTCLGITNPPGSYDVDIFVAEGQSFGNPPSFGGPGLGIFTVKEKFMRKIPGRLVGQTKEINGDKVGYILTLQAREQHIRREKASSNICTNQALCALMALTYLVSLGETGLREVAIQNFQKADYTKKKLAELPGYKILNKKPTYNEFLLECPNLDTFIEECKKFNLLPPLKISKYYPNLPNVALVCVTELNSRDSIELLIKAAKNANKLETGEKK